MSRAEHVSGALLSWAIRNELPHDIALNGDLAIFSPGRTHRYMLTRGIGAGERIMAGIGANPSVADAFKNDPTIKRGIGFASSWGCGLYIMLNAYAWRSTDPDVMWKWWKSGADIDGVHNDDAISTVLELCRPDDVVLAAWGKIARRERALRIAELARLAGVPLRCLGANADGSPKHPLYLAANTELQPWVPR